MLKVGSRELRIIKEDAWITIGLCASQTKPICPDPAPPPSAKSFWLYFAETRSIDPSKEARRLGRPLPVRLAVDAMVSSIGPFFPPDYASAGLYASSVVFVAVELASVLWFDPASNLDSYLSLHE